MHGIDRTQLEAAEGYRSPYFDEFSPGSGKFREAGRFDESAGLAPEHQSPLGEQQRWNLPPSSWRSPARKSWSGW
jgi:hypothetical protein